MKLEEKILERYNKRKNQLNKELEGLEESVDFAKEKNELLKSLRSMKEKLELKEKSKNIKCYVEEKYIGKRALIHKQDSSIKLYSEEGTEITDKFKDIVSQSKLLSDSDFILDCDVVESKEELIFNVWDIPYFEKDITKTPLSERKKILNSFNFTKNIRKGISVECNSLSEISKGITFVESRPGIIGVTVRNCSSEYKKGTDKDTIMHLSKKVLPVKRLVLDEDNKVLGVVKYSKKT